MFSNLAWENVSPGVHYWHYWLVPGCVLPNTDTDSAQRTLLLSLISCVSVFSPGSGGEPAFAPAIYEYVVYIWFKEGFIADYSLSIVHHPVTRSTVIKLRRCSSSNHTVFEWDTSMCWFHGCYYGRYVHYITTLCLNGTLPCVGFMDVIMGDIPYITTLCLNGTLPCVGVMAVTMGDIPYMTTLCLNGTLPCVGFMDVIMGDMYTI